jgi:hypothetical protein
MSDHSFTDLPTGAQPDDHLDLPSVAEYQAAKRALTAFKFEVIETVRADPKLTSDACLGVMSVHLDFLSIDPATLRPSMVYASTITVMARGGIKARGTVRRARKELVALGYLQDTGKKTKDGCQVFRVQNPRRDKVLAHVHETDEYLKQEEARRREDERFRKKHSSRMRGATNDRTQNGEGVN